MRSKRIAIVAATAAELVVSSAVVAISASNQNASSDSWQMGGRYYYQPAKSSPVRTLAGAKADAQTFAARLGLRVDEVRQFADNYYAMLLDTHGNGATEVLVDPASGVVSVECVPAMMWNTPYGTGRGAAGMMGSYGESLMRGSGGAMKCASATHGGAGGVRPRRASGSGLLRPTGVTVVNSVQASPPLERSWTEGVSERTYGAAATGDIARAQRGGVLGARGGGDGRADPAAGSLGGGR